MGADVVEIYRDNADEWRWRRLAGNSQIVSTSGEGYTERNDAREAAERVNPGVEIHERDPE